MQSNYNLSAGQLRIPVKQNANNIHTYNEARQTADLTASGSKTKVVDGLVSRNTPRALNSQPVAGYASKCRF